ncbi:MAG: aminotransferase class I/II-fold pyridoxal phosphate-dependent enzyme, partial [Eubacteriales bacterium]|nr:aminotransferase class I/II-fold pyridoxal phosphate-dependent enzyme [Eubacteriales bacterium]
MLYIELDSDKILYKQIYEQLAEHIRQQHLTEDSKLPGIRSLANELGVSVNTVNQAYQQLLVEGYIYSKERSGYFVKSIDNLLTLPQAQEDIPKEEEKDYVYNFSISGVDEAHFPYEDWRRVFRKTIRKATGILTHTPPKGLYELREEITRYLESARGIKVDPHRIIVSTGISQLIALLENILPGNPLFALENPGYMVGKTAYLHASSKYVAINHLHYDE